VIPFEMVEPTSLREALGLLDPQEPTIRPVAGGTALMLMMKAGVFTPTRLVCLHRIEPRYSRIALGDSGATPRRRLVHLAPGLGLAPGLIIDQHFRRRDRLGRLLTALSYHPGLLGVGVDEDTAAAIDAEGSVRVLGTGAITIVDAHDMRYTDSHAAHRGQPLAMLGVRLDVLTAGCRYDLAQRRAYPPPQGAARLEAEDLPGSGLDAEEEPDGQEPAAGEPAGPAGRSRSARLAGDRGD